MWEAFRCACYDEGQSSLVLIFNDCVATTAERVQSRWGLCVSQCNLHTFTFKDQTAEERRASLLDMVSSGPEYEGWLLPLRRRRRREHHQHDQIDINNVCRLWIGVTLHFFTLQLYVSLAQFLILWCGSSVLVVLLVWGNKITLWGIKKNFFFCCVTTKMAEKHPNFKTQSLRPVSVLATVSSSFQAATIPRYDMMWTHFN